MNQRQWRRNVSIASIGAGIAIVAAAQYFDIPTMLRTQVAGQQPCIRNSSSEGPADQANCPPHASPAMLFLSSSPSSSPKISPSPLPPCADGKDNDGSGFADKKDPSCYEGFDLNKTYFPRNTEGPKPACADNKDNDGDRRKDKQDPGCFNLAQEQELAAEFPNVKSADNATKFISDLLANGEYLPWRDTELGEPGCADGKDNDGDDLIDDNDPGCENPKTGRYNPFESETGEGECDDTVDNDGDGFIDTADPGCYDNGNKLTGTFNNNENEIGGIACSDGVDNDGDKRVDINDPGCHRGGVLKFPFIGLPSPYNPRDTNEGGEAACADGKDNDGDRLTDEADPGCHLGGRLNWAYLPRRNRE